MINCPRNIKYRLLEVAADHARSLLKDGDCESAISVLEDARGFDLEDAAHYLESDVGANLALENYWAVKEAEEQGHTIVDVLPVEGQEWTCTIECQKPGRQAYYIHLDDGDLSFNLNPDWHNKYMGAANYYMIQSYQHIKSRTGFEGI